MTAEIFHIDFARKLQHAPYTLAERLEDKQLEIIKLETALGVVVKQYEQALDMWDVFGGFSLMQNGARLRSALQDAYFERDILMDEA